MECVRTPLGVYQSRKIIEWGAKQWNVFVPGCIERKSNSLSMGSRVMGCVSSPEEDYRRRKRNPPFKGFRLPGCTHASRKIKFRRNVFPKDPKVTVDF